MIKAKLQVPSEIYNSSLHTISGVKFSQREIDVISCVMQMRTGKRIASQLSIAPKTIESHIRNITQKIECSSREGIVDFIEKSDKYLEIKNYYTQLLILKVFEQLLLTLSKKIANQVPKYNLIYKKTDASNTQLAFIRKHLQLFGLKDLPIELDSESDTSSSATINVVLTVQEEDNYYLNFFNLLKKLFPGIDFSPYLLDFEKQCNRLVDPNTSARFKEKRDIEPGEAKNTRKQKWGLIGIIGSASLVLFALISYLFIPPYTDQVICSSLNVPVDTAILTRSKLLVEINNKLIAQKGIQNIALIGVGGAGKTTLARQYARTQKASVVWEFNAETTQSLRNGAESLAYALCKSDEDRKILQDIQEIKDTTSKQNGIILFIKKKLKSKPDWILIFDNVDNFQDIVSFYPSESAAWGLGKVLITSQDLHIHLNNLVKSFLVVGEISAREKEDLFDKIMFYDTSQKISNEQLNKRKEFLKNLPPYPLDVAIAAYYLRTTQISYKEYLNNLSKADTIFNSTQEHLVKEATDYSKTRYQIITASLRHLIASNKDFADLLIFISLIDSQNIPKRLLEVHKSSTIVDSFIYNLKKYSLIISEINNPTSGTLYSIHRSTQIISFEFLLNSMNLIKNNSMIEKMSASFAHYVQKKIQDEEFGQLNLYINHLEKLLTHEQLLSNYTQADMKEMLGRVYFHNFEFNRSKLILEKTLLKIKNIDNFKWEKVGNICLALGNAYKYLNKFDKSLKFYQNAILLHEQNSPNQTCDLAILFLNLGELYRIIADYKIAFKTIEKSVHIFEKTYSDKHISVARALSALGVVSLKLGNFDHAKGVFNRSNDIFCNFYPDQKEGVGLNYLYLGDICYELGDYLGAQEFYNLSQSTFFEISEGRAESFYNSWVLGHLGALNVRLGNYKAGEEYLNEALKLHNTFISDMNNNYKAWLQFYLGEVALESGDFSKAESLIRTGIRIYTGIFGEKSLRNLEGNIFLARLYIKKGLLMEAKTLLENNLKDYELHLKEDSIESARALRILGEVFILEGKIEIAEKCFKKSLVIFNMHNSGESSLVYEMLSELYEMKSRNSSQEGDIYMQNRSKSDSFQCLERALSIAKLHFPKNSFHFKRIQEKMDIL
jgi:tetratricopeptide (TPR) repeat protein/DNA-binding CsgD family transcriptional regulator